MTDLILLGILDGLAYGALVFLVAVGLTMIFGVMRILNVAHGSFYALGAYMAASLGLWITSAQWAPWLSFPAMLLAAILVGGILGSLVERFILRRVYLKEEVLQLLVTFALFMMLEDVQRLVWGVQPYYFDAPVRMMGNVEVLGIFYTSYQVLFLPLMALVVLVGLRLFLRNTLTGKMVTAVTLDREVSETIGINAKRIFLFTFAFGAALAALGGALAAPTTSLVPGIGTEMIVLSFAVAATAGLGQVEGAIVTALAIGLGRSLATYLYPEVEVIIPYLIMMVVLLFRPNGLFGVAETRKV